ncbi:hypothetical protein FRC20_001572 [Serendipita sp. 405]|nr:hypothetical protein FRC20_001572 [Serendipita sp. 405]
MSTITLDLSPTSSSFTPPNSTIPSLNSTLPSALSTTGYVPWWHGDWRYWFYFLAHSIGGAGLTLLLLTMCLPLKRVRRNPVLISMCFSWWLGSFPNTTLLFYTNNVLGGPPSQAVCLASAALVMAQTPLNAVCAVVLVYNVWSILYFTTARSTSSTARTFMLVCIPYVIFFVCAGAVLTVGLLHPDLVGRATFYCVVRSNTLMIFLGVFGGICCVLAIGMEAWIAILLRSNKSKSTHKHNHHYTNDANRNQSMDTSASSSRLDLQLAVRVILFGFYIFFGLALSVLSILNWTSVVPDLCFATFSIAVFAIFGSQQDVMGVWKKVLCCCRSGEQRNRRSTSHVRAGSEDSREGDPKFGHPFGANDAAGAKGAHNAYWCRRPDNKNITGKNKSNKTEEMGDLATLRTRNTTQTGIGFDKASPYNSQTDFQFQYESDLGLGMTGNGNQGPVHQSNKSKDAWWGYGVGPNGKPGKSKRPGTGNSAKRPGTGNSAMRPGTAGSQLSMSWYPDLGYDFAPEGTSHTADVEVEMEVAGYSGFDSTSGLVEGKKSIGGEKSPRKAQHANPHTRHSSATVPSEYIGTSPRSPEFIYYEPSPVPASSAVPGLVPSTSLSPSSTSPLSPSSASPLSSFPFLSSTNANQFPGNTEGKEVVTLKDGVKQAVGQKGFAFPLAVPMEQSQSKQYQYQNPHAPTVNSRLHIEHHLSPSTDTSSSIHFAPSDSIAYPPRTHGQQDSFIRRSGVDQYRDSTDANGLPGYYLREYSHTHVHSTDYRSSLDSSIGGGARAAIKNGTYPYMEEQEQATGPTTLYDSNYPDAYDYSSSGRATTSTPRYGYTHHANISTPHRAVDERDEVYAPVPKSAFDRESNGFEFISGRKRTGGASSPDSFLTNPSLYNGRPGYGY